MEKPRLARLTAILTQLQSKKIVTARELAEKHQVSIRTIYRDIRTLEQSNVPIATEEGKGYSLVEGYQLPPVMFTESEANALITAEQLLHRNTDQSLVEEYQSAITKIRSVLKYTGKDKAELLSERIQIRQQTDANRRSNYLITIQSSIINHQLLEINYTSLEDKVTQRYVEPFAVYSTGDQWLLIAICRLRKAFRAFRLDRINTLRVTGEQFPPHEMTLQDYFELCIKNQSPPDIPLTSKADTFAANT